MDPTGWIIAAILWTIAVGYGAYKAGYSKGRRDENDDMHQTHI